MTILCAGPASGTSIYPIYVGLASLNSKTSYLLSWEAHSYPGLLVARVTQGRQGKSRAEPMGGAFFFCFFFFCSNRVLVAVSWLYSS
jgi:hypothetical protein